MFKTKIEYCDSTWNPVSGCLHECPYCYARSTANRFKGNDDGLEPNASIVELEKPLYFTGGDGKQKRAPYPFGFTPTLHKYRLNYSEMRYLGKTVFVCSMGDLFGSWVPDDWISQVFNACSFFPNRRFLFLTKNPGRYKALAENGMLPEMENFWYGATYSGGEECSAVIPDLGDRNTFLSIEPLIGPVDLEKIEMNPKWIILGAETGNRKDRVSPEKEWVDSVVAYCKDRNVPLFMKDSMVMITGDSFCTEVPWEDKKNESVS